MKDCEGMRWKERRTCGGDQGLALQGEKGMRWRARRACGGGSEGMRWRAGECKDKVELTSGFVVEGEAYVRGSGRHAVDGMWWRVRTCVVVEGASAKHQTYTQSTERSREK